MATTGNDIDFPDELLDKLENFHQAVAKMTKILDPLETLNFNSSDYQLDPLEKARLNLASGYALNSLFWMYLNTLGIDPKEHRIKAELERYGSFMLRIREITDKAKAPVLDKGAAGRFIRNALWEPKEKEQEDAASSSINEIPIENKRIKKETHTNSYSNQVERKKRRH